MPFSTEELASCDHSEFYKIGDSAIVTVGDFKQNDGVVSSPQQLPSLPLRVQDPWQQPH
eukprot:COSAG04_NODE_14320_length_572_cov_1.854123_1_plen_58_part_10